MPEKTSSLVLKTIKIKTYFYENIHRNENWVKHPKTYCDWSNFTSKSPLSTSKSRLSNSKSSLSTSKLRRSSSQCLLSSSKNAQSTSSDELNSSLTYRNPSPRHRTTSKEKYGIFAFVILNEEK